MFEYRCLTLPGRYSLLNEAVCERTTSGYIGMPHDRGLYLRTKGLQRWVTTRRPLLWFLNLATWELYV